MMILHCMRAHELGGPLQLLEGQDSPQGSFEAFWLRHVLHITCLSMGNMHWPCTEPQLNCTSYRAGG